MPILVAGRNSKKIYCPLHHIQSRSTLKKKDPGQNPTIWPKTLQAPAAIGRLTKTAGCTALAHPITHQYSSSQKNTRKVGAARNDISGRIVRSQPYMAPPAAWP